MAPVILNIPGDGKGSKMTLRWTSGVSHLRRLSRSLAIGLFALLFATTARAATFTVNNTLDIGDGTKGDGVCETAKNNHICTFRAAIEEANALAGTDTIQLQANAKYVLSLTSSLGATVVADILISDSVNVVGAGPASTIIDGNGVATGQGVFRIIPCNQNAFEDMVDNCTQGRLEAHISGVTIENGVSPSSGGGIYNAGILTLDHVNLIDNSVSGGSNTGGGIASAQSGTLTVTNSLISNNTCNNNGSGGGIFSQGPMTISGSTISGNKALQGSGSSGHGGGVYSGDESLVTNSTISGNSATAGGGIYHFDFNGTLTLINTTISGNSSAGSGAGIYNYLGTLGLYNATVTENGANTDESGFDSGGGIYNASGQSTYVINSIVSGNTLVIPTAPFPTLASDECGGTITSFGYNIMAAVDTSHCTVAGAYTADDPLLGPLQFNGGTTQTHALSVGSPAIDKGNPAGCTDQFGAPINDDQRGVHRPYGTYCDIGAFEWADVIFKNGFQ
jgi:hypothetical protein